MLRFLFFILFAVVASAALPRALRVWGCGAAAHNLAGFKACVVGLEKK